MHHVAWIYLNNALWLKACVLTTPLRPKAVVLVTHSRGNRKVRVIISHRSGSFDPCGSGGTPGQGSKHKKVIRGKFVLDRKTVPGTKTAGGRARRTAVPGPLGFEAQCAGKGGSSLPVVLGPLGPQARFAPDASEDGLIGDSLAAVPGPLRPEASAPDPGQDGLITGSLSAVPSPPPVTWQ